MNTVWSFFHKTTGTFLPRRLAAAETNLAANTPEGYVAIAGEYDWQSQRVDVGTGEVIEYRPPAPPDTEFETFDWNAEARRYVAVPTLAARRAAKWEQIKAARDAAEWGGFTWDGAAFDSDALSQQRIQGAVQLALLAAQGAQPFTIDWTLADNSVRSLDGEAIVAVGMALAQHVETQFAKGRALRAAIAEATDEAALALINWSA